MTPIRIGPRCETPHTQARAGSRQPHPPSRPIAQRARARRTPMTVEPTDRPADLVLTGGRIATMDAARHFASALAVRDGRILAVGPEAAVAGHIGPRTRVIALR